MESDIATNASNISTNDTDISNLQSDKYDKTGGTISGNVTVTGDLSATNLGGTLSTAAQPNVTSVGTLSSLAVSGGLTSGTAAVLGNGTNTFTNYSISGSGIGFVGDANWTFGGSSSDLSIRGTNNIVFGIGFTEDMRLNSSGNLAFINGGGIDFSASAGGGASSSLLDDYEEGTWTPTITATTTAPSGVTYNFRGGRYTKIGRMVSIQFGMQLSNAGSGGSGNINITGLPFTALSAGAYQEPATRIFVTNFTTTSYASSFYGYVAGTIMDFRIGQNVDAAVDISELQNNTSLNGNIIYYI
jgi:hypothetical protein